jgi:hypothetical protein
MTQPVAALPIVGSPEGAAETLVTNALAEIQSILRGGLDASNIKDDSISGAKLENGIVTGSKIADATIPVGKLAFRMLFGVVTSTGAADPGSGGYTTARTSVGGYTVTFTTPMPTLNFTVLVTPIGTSQVIPQISARAVGSVSFVFRTNAGAGVDTAFSFLVLYP